MKRGKREVKRAYGLGRRFLAMFLAMVMCTSMLQLTAFAAEYKNQVMPGSYIVDANGNAVATTDTVVEQDGFTLKKEIKQTGKDAFNITLTVETSQTVTTNEAAIQLVIDTSTSMDYCSNCSSSSSYNSNCSAHNVSDRMTEVKKVLTMDGGFLDSLVEANTGAINVSVVTYGLGAKTVTLDRADADQWIDIKDPAALAKAKSAINDLDTTDNATNMQAGLMLARNRLGMDAVKNAAVKYTVLLTDGYANTYTRNDDKNSTTSISNGSSPSGPDGTDAGKNNATSMAGQVKATNTLLYAVGYGTDKPYLTDIIGDETKVFVGSDSASVAGAFKDIAEAAVSGMTGAGTAVTDPMGTDGGKFTMGQFIVLGDVSGLADKGVTSSGGTLTWELDPAKAKKETVGDTTTYTYSITYPITLNTAAEGFEEGKYYPTNGYTYLSVPQADGSTKPIAFLVPGVCGEIPEVDWSVKYYLQGEATKGDYANYTEVDTYDGPDVKLWTKVYTPDGYAEKYDDQDYQHVSGTSELTLSSTNAADNVMRHYYDRIQANATVQHWYKTNTWTRAGEYIAGEYTTAAMTSGTVEGLYVGESYKADRVYKYGDFYYTADESVNESNCPEGGNQRINTDTISNVSRDSEKNVINFYYTRTVDERQPTSAKVLHTYVTSGYVLENGKYVEKEIGRNTVPVQDESELIATTSFDVISAPVTGYESYTLTEKGDYNSLTDDGNGNLSFVLVEDPAQNIRELVFEGYAEDEREPVTVTVRHYYTKVVTEVVDGVVDGPKTVVNNVLGNEDVFEDVYYVGEFFTAVENKSYNGDTTYNSDITNDDKLETIQLTGNTVIELHYNLTVEPQTTMVIVNHHYRTTTTTITEDIDADGNVTGYTETENTTTETESVEIDELYVNQTFVAELEGRAYFTFNEAESDAREVTATEDPVVIDLYYDRDDTNDLRRGAEIDVQHNYYVNLETIVDGQVGYRKVAEGSETESFPQGDDELKAGKSFTADPDTKDDRYTVDEETSDPRTVVLQPGINDTIVINYIRNDSNLVSTDYTVNYVYNTYNMYVDDDGVAKYPSTPTSTENGEQVTGTGYVGQNITLDPKTRVGFTASEGNPAAEQTLDESNAWTFVYEKYIPLNQGTVQVNHHYTTNTIAINGTTSSSTSTTTGTPVAKYVGETYVANADLKGFALVDSKVTTEGAVAATEDVQSSYTLIVIDGAIVVDFYYEKTINNSKTAEYKVYHEYYLYDYDGTLLNENKPAPETGTGFATNPVKAMPDANDGYELISATYNGAPLEADYTFQLIEGENNVVVFVYKKTLPQDKVDVKVIHNYYKDEASMTGETAEVESRHEQTFTEVFEDSVFTAAEYYMEDAAYTYTFHSSDPKPDAETGAVSITVSDEGENVIIMNYVRATAEYKVIHIYNRNGVEEDRVTETLGGLDGDVVLADSIDRVPVHDGKTYTFQSISGDLVLNEEEQQVIVLDSEEMQTVILVYNRRVSSGGGGGGGTIIIPEPPVPLDPQPEPEVEIPEEDVPLVEIPEEEVPLVDVPKTGDASALWMLMSVLSGTGLAGVTFLGRKKKEEE